MTETQICAAEGCENEFVAKSRSHKYCSIYCRQNGKVCVDCGSVTCTRSKSGKCINCSNKRLLYDTGIDAACSWCGERFRKTHKLQLRCPACRNKKHKPKNTLMTCAAQDCSNIWIRKEAEVFCSDVCRAKWSERILCPSCGTNPMAPKSKECKDCHLKEKASLASHKYCFYCDSRIPIKSNLCGKCKDWERSLPNPTVKMICPCCNKWFVRSISKWRSVRKKRIQYCSISCASKSNNPRKYWDVIYPCDYCSKDFLIAAGKYRRSIAASSKQNNIYSFYCSPLCRKLSRQNIFKIPYHQVHGIRGVVHPKGGMSIP